MLNASLKRNFPRNRVPIEGFPNYEIDSYGNVWSKYTGVILTPWLSNSGYLMVKLRNGNDRCNKYVHRLVAETFLYKDRDGLEVNHIDGDKLNNSVENLEWCTHSENTLHAIRNNLFTPYKLPPHPKKTKRVRIVETGEVFDSLTECAEYISGFKTAISACLLGKVKTHKGYHFEEV